MYPQVNKEQNLPSAPPSYSDSINAPKYEPYNPGNIPIGHSYNASTMGPPQPTQVIVVQTEPVMCKWSKMYLDSWTVVTLLHY